jgi:uncharacterized protein YbjT (DUF2867 family)
MSGAEIERAGMITDVAPIVTVFGGSGFVGRYICQRMARAGWRVRVAVRRPNEAVFVRTYGVVGQVLEMQANIRDDASVRRAIHGVEAVINCVGTFEATGRQSFQNVQVDGAARIARIAAEEGAQRLVHISAIGADPASPSEYGRSKAAGEDAVTRAFPGAVILRPSIIFGVEDKFFNRFASMTRFMPVLPLVGPDTRFQPVYVDDVAKAAAQAVTGDVEPGIYELGGPEAASFGELMQRMLHVIRRRRPLVALPFGVADAQARALDFLQRASFGLFTNTVLTRDQVRMLQRDNVVSPGARGFEAFGIAPMAMEAILDSYLVRYRPAGQFTAVKETTAKASAERKRA